MPTCRNRSDRSEHICTLLPAASPAAGNHRPILATHVRKRAVDQYLPAGCDIAAHRSGAHNLIGNSRYRFSWALKNRVSRRCLVRKTNRYIQNNSPPKSARRGSKAQLSVTLTPSCTAVTVRLCVQHRIILFSERSEKEFGGSMSRSPNSCESTGTTPNKSILAAKWYCPSAGTSLTSGYSPGTVICTNGPSSWFTPSQLEIRRHTRSAEVPLRREVISKRYFNSFLSYQKSERTISEQCSVFNKNEHRSVS